MPLSLAWNIILKSLTEFVFSKASEAFTKNDRERVCHGLCDGVSFKFWAVRESAFMKAVNLY